MINNTFCGTLPYVFATMAQEVERRLGKAEATGSNPVSSFWVKGHIGVGMSFFVYGRI